MARLLFVVHGMGCHDPDWCGGIVDTLNSAASRYAAFAGRTPFTRGDAGPDEVKIVQIRYDDVFDAWRASLDANTGALQQAVAAGQVVFPGAEALLGWLNTAPEDDRQFFWSHVVDVLLYRFTFKAGEVRARVMQQIATALTDAMQSGEAVEASVMAHSLGTSVAHDSLALLGTTPLDGSTAFMTPRLFKNLFMIANVSRVLQSPTLGVYETIVRPRTAAPDGYVDAYFNVRHRLDPFPAVAPFAPQAWGNRYVEIGGLDHLRQFNVHDFGHYLDAPRVHIPIFNNLFGVVVRSDERRAAEAVYDALPMPPCPEQVRQFKARVEQTIELLKTGVAPAQLLVAASQFLALAKEVQDACS